MNSSNDAYITLSHYIPIETGPDGLLHWSQCRRFETNVFLNGQLHNGNNLLVLGQNFNQNQVAR